MATSEIRLWPVPPNYRVASCRGCSARIVWAKTGKGKTIPLSIDHEDAKWVGEGAEARCEAAPSHFVDCVAANQFSKKGNHEPKAE